MYGVHGCWVGFKLLFFFISYILIILNSSLDQIYKKHGPFPLDVLKRIAYAVSKWKYNMYTKKKRGGFFFLTFFFIILDCGWFNLSL